ncbi:NXPE family member 3-like [Anneissia japonica]|uniref:NXPE family member 3-like n=1 Tax=Anneissia japonica TaxID=1529436 RepID=UPI001425BB0A|nr:NXPE family member 3-like [Anneissia japonica]
MDYHHYQPAIAGYITSTNNSYTVIEDENHLHIGPTLTSSSLHQNESIQNGADVHSDSNKTQHILFTDPKHCAFNIENQQNSSNLCDKIHVIIQARDQLKTNKKIGGDYFRAKIYNTKLKASAPTDGEVIDHNNGSYSAYFTVRWRGSTFINVQLVHSSEAVAAMKRVREANPIRMVYNGIFQQKKAKVNGQCHVQLSSANELCNFTDKLTGEPWFCIKPKNLPCSTYTLHSVNKKLGGRLTAAMFTRNETHLFSDIKRSIEMCIRDSAEIAIYEMKANVNNNSPRKVFLFRKADNVKSYKDTICVESTTECRPVTNSAKPEKKIAAGYYFQDKWYSNDCTLKNISVQSALTSKLLTNKRFYFYGDSTLRQWFEYFAASISDASIVQAAPGATLKTGPLRATSKKYNLTFMYRHHAFPIRTTPIFVKNVAYAANEIDNISADENTIICLCFFAHFTPTELHVYRRRLETTKASLLRLYKRSPETLVFLKTPNTNTYAGAVTSVDYGDWVSLMLDKELRKVMAEIPNLTIIDVWDMTTNHRLGENLHPPRPIIQQEIQLMLSLIFA